MVSATLRNTTLSLFLVSQEVPIDGKAGGCLTFALYSGIYNSITNQRGWGSGVRGEGYNEGTINHTRPSLFSIICFASEYYYSYKIKIQPHIIIIIIIFFIIIIIIITTLSSSHYQHTLSMLSIHIKIVFHVGSRSNATSLNFLLSFFFRYVAFLGPSLGRGIEVIIQLSREVKVMKEIGTKIQLLQLTLPCRHVSSISYYFNTGRFPITVPLNVTLKFLLRGIKSGALYF